MLGLTKMNHLHIEVLNKLSRISELIIQLKSHDFLLNGKTFSTTSDSINKMIELFKKGELTDEKIRMVFSKHSCFADELIKFFNCLKNFEVYTYKE